VRHAYPAIAIDERRRPFRPTLWEPNQDKPPENQTLEQVWFAGVHCDVGGGYRDPSLSEIPLLWMADRAHDCGLAFKPDRLVLGDTDPGDDRRAGIQVRPDPRGEKHESRTGFYRLLSAYDRRLAGEEGAEVAGGALASSARVRHDEDGGYRPLGVSEWLAGGRKVMTLRDGR
jgi:hypothetical protein